jgi:hypothetical protein
VNDLGPLLLMILLAGAALAILGSFAVMFADEDRRIRRALQKVLKGPPEASVTAPGRGRGAGFSFATGLAAVAWDGGSWCLVYRLEELVGAELIIDGQVMARAYRDEVRRPLDRVSAQASRVTLRLIFDDPRHADFDIDLWVAGDDLRRPNASPATAVQEANSWLARTDAILRRSRPRPKVAVPPPVQEAPPPASGDQPPLPFGRTDDHHDEDDDPPF